ncbi:hypothetical protein G9C98_006073 [Cotesia typhae]|uniref:Uncharacterized protein n=1 Tax=Cotesia typhae TaxID=2053667 RepID=A0A8J5URI7_9HYME|nr:hypothetical protein G9C98_006073 [Cotesia typhae]
MKSCITVRLMTCYESRIYLHGIETTTLALLVNSQQSSELFCISLERQSSTSKTYILLRKSAPDLHITFDGIIIQSVLVVAREDDVLRGKDQSEEATERPVHTNSVLMLRNKRIEDPEFKLPHTISKSYRDRARPAATVTSDCFCFSSADVHVQVSRHQRQQKRAEVERWI